ncbi:hypothetical protein LguiB_008552 [Lonicera macranthoides]
MVLITSVLVEFLLKKKKLKREEEVGKHDLEDLAEIESTGSFDVLGDSKPLFQGLAQRSTEQSILTSTRVQNDSRAICSNEVDSNNSNISPGEGDTDGFTVVCSKKQKEKLKKLCYVSALL